MEEIKQHCEKVIQILCSDYSMQLQYSGIIKKIYDVMQQIISCDNVNELPDIHWNSIARCFADETTDYQSPRGALLTKRRIIKVLYFLR